MPPPATMSGRRVPHNPAGDRCDAVGWAIAPDGLAVGAKVMSGPEAPPDLGNSLPLSIIPLGANIHNIEIAPGRGGQMARSAGQQATLSNREASCSADIANE